MGRQTGIAGIIRLFSEWAGLALVLFVVLASSAQAASSYFTFVPARFRTTGLTASSRGLGEICYSRDLYPDGTNCNPAYLPEVRESILVARLFLGNGYSALGSADSFVNQPLTRETMQGLFRGKNVIAVEAHAGLSFTTRYLSAEFSPYRVQYVSEIRNPNFPEVRLHAAIERSFNLGGGIELGRFSPELKDFRAGAKLRVLERKFVHGQFSFFQAVNEDPRSYLPSKKQNTYFLDPSIAWVGSSVAWKPRVSLALKNVGFAKPYHDEYPNDIDLEGGVGVEPPVAFGRVKLGLDWVDVFYAEKLEERFRLGASYRVGLMETMLGLNSSSFTMGLLFGLNFIQTAIVYEFFRNDLEGGGAETRLATEITLRL